jgi:hypothetical protein
VTRATLPMAVALSLLVGLGAGYTFGERRLAVLEASMTNQAAKVEGLAVAIKRTSDTCLAVKNRPTTILDSHELATEIARRLPGNSQAVDTESGYLQPAAPAAVHSSTDAQEQGRALIDKAQRSGQWGSGEAMALRALIPRLASGEQAEALLRELSVRMNEGHIVLDGVTAPF